uniref:Uncharacterized protein n=1 Tax=Strongyloides venezuelensis TaxID=75913 RepID=A0A0K0FR65_STRVS
MPSRDLRKRRCLNDVSVENVDENERNIATANFDENDENCFIENVNESQENVMTISSNEDNRITKRTMHDYPSPLNVSTETFFESVDNQLKFLNVEWKNEYEKEIIEIGLLQSSCLNVAKSLYHVCGFFKKADGFKYVNAFLKKYVCKNNEIRSNNAYNVNEPFDIHAEAKKFEKSMLKNDKEGLEYSVEHYVERLCVYVAPLYKKFFELVPSLSSYTRYLLEKDVWKLNSFNFDLIYEKFYEIEQFIANKMVSFFILIYILFVL